MVPKRLVSIIIPAYNVEQYIFRGIESLIYQTYKNIEIIIIDDGSSDNTLEIINDYKKTDDRIKFFHQKNQGVSAARNFGLEMAKGEFVLFLDSDDWLELNAVEVLVGLLEENIMCMPVVDRNICNIESDKIIKRTDANNKKCQINASEALLETGTGKYALQSSCYKLYDMSIINTYNIRFCTSIFHGEDGLFVFEYLKHIDGILYYSIPLWNILEREDSATSLPFNDKWMTALDSVNKMLSYDNTKELTAALNAYLVKRAIYVATNCIISDNYKTEYVEQLKIVMKEYKKDFLKQYGVKDRILYYFIVVMPRKLQRHILSVYFKNK